MKRILLASLLATTVLVPAVAADLPYRAAPAPMVDTWSPWMIRVRALGVIPQGSGKSRVDVVSSPVLPVGGIAGSDLDISNSVVPELDITYFFTKNIAAELILGTTPHTVKAAGTIRDLGDIGRTWLLPPTLTLQYHFNITDSIKPYVGAGINYTFFYSNKSKGIFRNFDVDNSFGFALQAGVDIMLDRHWGINFDVKKIWLEADAKAYIPSLDTHVKTKAKIDPWLIGVGVTYRF